MRLAAVLTCIAIGALAAPQAAPAAFPGRDGVIAFSSANEHGEDCGPGHDEGVFEPCVFSVFRVRPDGSGQKRLSSCGSTADPDCDDSSPAYSPGGTKIVFTRRGDLWLMNADGSGERPLGLRGASPAWAPDGRRIVFSQDGNIAVAPLFGRAELVTRGGGHIDPAWSSRDLIAFRRLGDGRSALFTMRPDGSRRRRILRDCGCGGPDFSPDGNRLLYTVGRGRTGLYVAGADGRDPRRIVTSGIGGVWSPSGRSIAYMREDDIWVARSDGTRTRRILVSSDRTVGDSITGDYAEPSWQPLPRR